MIKTNEIHVMTGCDYKNMAIHMLEVCELSEFIDKKARIGIKPNLVSPTPASFGATTHPEVVAGIIEYLRSYGFQDIVMLEGSWVGDRTADAVEVCGYKELSDKYHVPFLDMQKEEGMSVDCRGMNLQICKAALDIDFLINVPVLKGHCQTKITCALKNMKGLIPNAEKRRFHSLGLHKPIAHLNSGLRQDFILVDHICGDLDFEDGGNPVVRNQILAGLDPVLMDAYVCDLMQYDVSEVPYVVMAGELGVGCSDISKANIVFHCTSDKSSLPISRKVIEVSDAVEEVESCSACYGYLIPALEMLKEEGLLQKLQDKICIGQGYRGKFGTLGIGSCTKGFIHTLGGCPPTETQMYEFLKDYINNNNS